MTSPANWDPNDYGWIEIETNVYWHTIWAVENTTNALPLADMFFFLAAIIVGFFYFCQYLHIGVGILSFGGECVLIINKRNGLT